MAKRAGRNFFLILIAIAMSVGTTSGDGIRTTRGSLSVAANELTVSAAISLKDALDKIASLYSSEQPGTPIHFNLGGSGTLQRQIEQGAPVDIFISASPKEMDSLEAQGQLLAGTRRNLVKNRIVLIVPEGTGAISNFQDLTKPAAKVIAVGEPQTVPAGKYAQEVLTHLGLYDLLKPKLVLGKRCARFSPTSKRVMRTPELCMRRMRRRRKKSRSSRRLPRIRTHPSFIRRRL